MRFNAHRHALPYITLGGFDELLSPFLWVECWVLHHKG